jgi:ribosomal protein L7/L12
MPTDDPNLDPELQAFVVGGRKIEAIKRYRELTGAGLKDAKEAVEALERGEAMPVREQGGVPFETEIVVLLKHEQKLDAIKLYRERTGAGLKEAKDFIEALAADNRIAAQPKSGCLGVVLLVAAALVMIVAKSLAAEPPRPLDFRTIALNGDKGGTLAIVDGQPVLVNSPSAWNEWTLQESDKGWTIQGRLSREKNEVRLLGVDTAGKLTLLAKPDDGAYWKLTRKGNRSTSFDATLQASGGKFDAWYLGFSDEAEQVEKGKFKYKSYLPKLSKESGPRTKLHIFIDGP